jgi:hypothetical protein
MKDVEFLRTLADHVGHQHDVRIDIANGRIKAERPNTTRH